MNQDDYANFERMLIMSGIDPNSPNAPQFSPQVYEALAIQEQQRQQQEEEKMAPPAPRKPDYVSRPGGPARDLYDPAELAKAGDNAPSLLPPGEADTFNQRRVTTPLPGNAPKYDYVEQAPNGGQARVDDRPLQPPITTSAGTVVHDTGMNNLNVRAMVQDVNNRMKAAGVQSGDDFGASAMPSAFQNHSAPQIQDYINKRGYPSEENKFVDKSARGYEGDFENLTDYEEQEFQRLGSEARPGFAAARKQEIESDSPFGPTPEPERGRTDWKEQYKMPSRAQLESGDFQSTPKRDMRNEDAYIDRDMAMVDDIGVHRENQRESSAVDRQNEQSAVNRAIAGRQQVEQQPAPPPQRPPPRQPVAPQNTQQYDEPMMNGFF